MIEAAINISEGKNKALVDKLSKLNSTLDTHSDPYHNRSVITLACEPKQLQLDIAQLVQMAIQTLDLSTHQGVHPRFGVVDVVPFVDLDNNLDLSRAIEQRDQFAKWAGEDLEVPCFLYGPRQNESTRSLPELRKGAFVDFLPDFGPPKPHPKAGAIAVGARGVLIAYNLWLLEPDLEKARAIAKKIRSKDLRALGIQVGNHVQVSLNLINPYCFGPEKAYDLISTHAQIARAELVGLIPEKILTKINPTRWEQLDLSQEKTIESRLK